MTTQTRLGGPSAGPQELASRAGTAKLLSSGLTNTQPSCPSWLGEQCLVIAPHEEEGKENETHTLFVENL